jgi:hypothetical protein
MKRCAKINLTLIVLFSLSVCVQCSLIGKEEFLASEEARLEVRSASQKASTNLDEARHIPSIQALNYLTDLLAVHTEKQLPILIDEPFLRGPGHFFPLNILLHEEFLQTFSPEIITDTHGLYKFNFLTGNFDLIDLEVDYLRYIFPANDNDKDSLKITASFTIEDVDYVEIETTIDKVLQVQKHITGFQASIFLNKRTQMMYSYHASFSHTGLPVDIDIEMSMSPYHLRMKQVGDKQYYYTTMSMTLDNNPLMSYLLNIRRDADTDAVEKLSGSFQLNHIEWEGTVYSSKIKLCDEQDIDCVNDQFTITMSHSGSKRRIGKLEARLYYDSFSGEQYPELNLIYEDGSSDVLSEILEVGPNKLENYFRK